MYILTNKIELTKNNVSINWSENPNLFANLPNLETKLAATN